MDANGIANAIGAQVLTAWHAPIPFLAAVIAVGLLIWWFVQREFATRLSNAESHKTLLEGQIEDYKDKLSGATPQEAKERIAELERAVAALQPAQRALTEDQRKIIADNIRGIPQEPRELYLIYVSSSHECATYAQDFSDALVMGGWNITPDVVLGQQRIRFKGVSLIAGPGAFEWPSITALIAALKAAGVDFTVQTKEQMVNARLCVDMAP
jgi:hypothetical protein